MKEHRYEVTIGSSGEGAVLVEGVKADRISNPYTLSGSCFLDPEGPAIVVRGVPNTIAHVGFTEDEGAAQSKR